MEVRQEQVCWTMRERTEADREKARSQPCREW